MTKMNNEQLSGLFMVIEEWSGYKWKDPLVTLRFHRLKQKLKVDATAITDSHSALVDRFVDEHQAPGKEKGRLTAEGMKLFREAEKRLMEEGEHEVTERFKYSELVIRERDPETGKVNERRVDLSINDVERFGEVLELDVAPNP